MSLPEDTPNPFFDERPPVAAPLYPKDATVLPPERKPISRRQAANKRQDLIARFVDDVRALWEEQGEAVLRRAAFHEPLKFAQMVANLVPRQVEHNVNPMEDIDDEQLDKLIALARAVDARNSGAIAATPSAREAAPHIVEPATPLQTISEAD